MFDVQVCMIVELLDNTVLKSQVVTHFFMDGNISSVHHASRLPLNSQTQLFLFSSKEALT